MKTVKMNTTHQSLFIYPFALLLVISSAFLLEVNFIYLIVWIPYFYFIEIPFHEALHFTAGKLLNESCIIDLKHSLLNHLFGIQRTEGEGKPRNPFCRMIGQVESHKMIIMSLAPVFVLSVIWTVVWFITQEDTFLFFLVVSFSSALSDLYYVLFILTHKGFRFEDKGHYLIAVGKDDEQ